MAQRLPELTPAQKVLAGLIERIESVADLPMMVRSILRANKGLIMKKISETDDDQIRDLVRQTQKELDSIYAQLA
jgi:hypothetical protein